MSPVRECRRLELAGPLRQPGKRRVGRRHRIVNQQGERDDERTKRYSLHVDVHEPHDRKDDRQRERYGERDDQARSHAETDEAHHHDDGDRLYQRDHELADGLVDHNGLVRDQAGLNSDREIRGDLAPLPS